MILWSGFLSVLFVVLLFCLLFFAGGWGVHILFLFVWEFVCCITFKVFLVLVFIPILFVNFFFSCDEYQCFLVHFCWFMLILHLCLIFYSSFTFCLIFMEAFVDTSFLHVRQ